MTDQSLTSNRRGALTVGHGAGSSLTKEIESTMPLFPARTYKALRYSTSCLLTVTNGIPGGYVFRANDLFDPDFTGTGHQPMGFDQMMISYNHFTVVKAWIKVIFRNTSTSGGPCTVCIRQDADSAIILSIDRVVEFGGSVIDTLSYPGQYGANAALTLGVSIAKLQGLSQTALTADPTLRGNAASSPSEISYFHVMAWDSSGKSCSVACDVVLEQLACFTEPRDFAQSLRQHAETARLLDSYKQKIEMYESMDTKTDAILDGSVWVSEPLSK